MDPVKPKKALLQTEEEILMVKEHLVLTVMLDFLEIEARKARDADSPLARVLRPKLGRIQTDIPKRLYELHRAFRTSGIRILLTTRSRSHIEARYLCRGYEYGMLLQGDTVKAEIEMKLAREFGLD